MKKISLVVISSVLLLGIGTYAWMNQWKQEKIGSYTYRTNLFTNETERFDFNLGWISMEQAQKQDAELQAVLAQQTIQQQQYYQQQAAIPVSATFSNVNIQINGMGSKMTGTAEFTKAGFMGTTIDVVLYSGNGEVAGTASQYVRVKDGDKVPINMPIFMNGTYPNGKWDGTYEITVR